MASPGELVKTMANVLGISPATVTQYDRVLSESGLRTTSGRGRSAAKVTALDAANLLIAIAASPIAGFSAKHAVQTCKTYSALPHLRRAAWTDKFPRFGLPSLAALPANHSFGEALAAFIAASARGERFKIPDPPRRPIFTDFGCGVEFDGPRPWAQIIANPSSFTDKDSDVARLVYCREADTKTPPKGNREKKADLSQNRNVTFRTIRTLGALLSGEVDS